VLLELLFRHAGYAVQCLREGTAAVEAIAELQPDLVVLDVELPSLNGLAVLAHLRRAPATSSTPVLLLSARARPSDIEQGLRSGAQAFLPKPFRVTDLLDTVKELLASTQQEGPKEPDPRD
jgi:DNA-binding response OmpR family regulator